MYSGRPMKTARRMTILNGLRLAAMMTATPKPALLVLNKADNALAIVDPASGKVVGLVPVGESPHEVTVSSDGTLAFVANFGARTITEIERVQTQIPVGKGPEAIDISPDRKEVWTAHGGDGGVSIIDPATRRVTQTLDLHTRRSNRLKFTPDGKLVLITDDGGGDLLILKAATRKEIKRIGIGHGPEGILIVPGGSRSYIALSRDNRVAILDLQTLEVTGSVETGRNPDGMA